MVAFVKKRVKATLARSIKWIMDKSGLLFPGTLYQDSWWYESPNLWEPPVLLILKDLIRAGMVAYDVGGNVGGLTSAMARLVGPGGTVCSFEASPRIFAHLQRNVALQGHSNVTVYHNAVYSTSNDTIMVYEGDHLNDSIFIEQSPTKKGYPVKTMALDDFCEATGLYPELIKMDIEGAEFGALLGSARMIERAKPHIVFEQIFARERQPADMKCIEFLNNLGYVCMDVNTYRQVCSYEDFPAGANIRNILAIHEAKLDCTPYKFPITKTHVRTLTDKNFNSSKSISYTSEEFKLKRGRYAMDVSFVAEGFSNNLVCGVRANDRVLFRNNAYSRLIAESYRDWVFEMTEPGTVCVFFDFLDGTSDPTFRIDCVTVEIIDGLRMPQWAQLVMI